MISLILSIEIPAGTLSNKIENIRIELPTTFIIMYVDIAIESAESSNGICTKSRIMPAIKMVAQPIVSAIM